VSVSFKTGCDGLSTMKGMRVGIGLPAAVPDADMALIGDWARRGGGSRVCWRANAVLLAKQLAWDGARVARGRRRAAGPPRRDRAGRLRPGGAETSDGWVSPLFNLPTLRDGAAAVAQAWDEAGREGRPRIMAERYFCFGSDADSTADAYIHHYYGERVLRSRAF
jgi:alkanesulfonate monooxygenase SsuD/methylene tetrahydromethanopterin reductase-like flavin-dependent oxidoreductase (luciferase family)